jgi:proteasome lid subunit RPN8/RPN11
MTLPSFLLELRGDLIAHAFREAPKEACGIVVNGEYFPCENIHFSPLENFAISPQDYAKAAAHGDVQAIFHSHPGDFNAFSPHDAAGCRAMEVPWIMYCLGTDDFHFADPSGKAPYLGREWHYGIHDCYSLVRDFYRREFGIQLEDFKRGEEQEWESPDWDMFAQNMQGQGFMPCEKAEKRGDFLLMQLQAPRPNHAGVLVDPERNIFYHHLLGRLSEANVYGGYWERNTSMVWRHKELW